MFADTGNWVIFQLLHQIPEIIWKALEQ